MSTSFKYCGETHSVLEEITIRGKTYLVVKRWGDTRYKVFDPSIEAWRSIRRRDGGVRHEMSLMQFSRLSSDSLPTVFDFYKDDKKEYLIQEWIDGFWLRWYLDQKRKEQPYLAAERSYYLMRGFINGLNQLHRNDVYHGDIRPENLIVGNTKRLYMIDFGAAWSGAKTTSRPRQKSNYSAPEQWATDRRFADHRADQFSASVILYEMLTGELPYDGHTSFAPSSGKRPRLIQPSKKNSNVWSSLDQVVMKGLSADENQRYETTQVWLNELYKARPPDHPARSSFSFRDLLIKKIWRA